MQIGKLLQLIGMLAVLMVGGTFGYMYLEGWDLLDALYMTVITLSTVGFSEVNDLTPEGRVFTIVLILLGVGNMAYILSSLFQFALEIKLNNFYKRQRMMNKIKKIENHTIVCGFGKMGQQIAFELHLKRQPFVVIDFDPAKEELLIEHDFPYLIGTASEDDNLKKMGIERAKNLVTVVNSDSENVFITLTARAINKDIHIISRIANESTRPKLVKAGANKIISPYTQASAKIAQSIINPAIDDFLEIITDDKIIEFQMADVLISDTSSHRDKKLSETNFKDTGIMIVGIWKKSGDIVYAPGPNEVIHSGDRLIAIGNGEEFCKSIAQMS